MVRAARKRTPQVSLKGVFLHAVRAVGGDDRRGGVVAEALDFLQRGFDAHYARGHAADGEILAGDDAYAGAVEIISCLNEPHFVAVASRMIRDGAGHISSGGEVSLETWVPHLADLLRVISGESVERSRDRVRRAAREAAG
ncbi:hypothetical protein [Rubrobacter calidifluminis]|uniref:hypothetical protein n=1 Tax=Rubrobacter calidifluminis TaxID=1392640 RepID=UPI0023604B5B|nr:hypothetical protein [Rubrobacter calidifluminis]